MNKYILGILIIPSIILLSNTNILRSVNYGQEINNNQRENTPLHQAIKDNNIDEAINLINQGANVNAQDIAGFTPLHWAVMDERQSLINLLLENGANPEIKDNGNNNPFYYLRARQRLRDYLNGILEDNFDNLDITQRQSH